jgi:hypothetical protein
MRKSFQVWLPIFLVICLTAIGASAQSFRVQCPTSTITHPDPTNAGLNNSEPPYNGPTQFNAPTVGIPAGTTGDFVAPVPGTVNGAIKCQQISGGDGYMTEADGTQTFMFSFGPLSGLADVAAGLPSTQFPNVFNTPYSGTVTRGDPATTDGASSGASPGVALTVAGTPPAFTWNGAVGLAPDIATVVTVSNLVEGPVATPATVPGCPSTAASANTVTACTDAPLGLPAGASVVIASATAEGGTTTPAGYVGT